jgi:ribosomal protein S18 acetylase RimI-like enzyme
MSIQLRPYEPQHYPAVLSLYQQALPPGHDPPVEDAPEMRRWLALESATGEIIGFTEAPLREVTTLYIMVAPYRQRQGLGNLLWERLRQDLVAAGTTAVEPWVREENIPGMEWLKQLGFLPVKQDWPVSFFPQEMDLTALQDAVEGVAAQGIVITTLAQERRADANCLPRLHALYVTLNAGVPGQENESGPTLEQFLHEQDEPDAIPDAYFIAKDGPEYVGLSYLRPRDADTNCVEPGNAQQCLTAVLPAYRRRGIALAMKVQVLQYARAHGYRRVLTYSANPAMRALNNRLGGRPGPWLIFRKTLP